MGRESMDKRREELEAGLAEMEEGQNWRYANKEAIAKGGDLAPKYRDSYEVGEITSFEEAKQAADETYIQYWYDRANEISSKWEDEDYALIGEPKTEKFCPNGGNICRVKHTRRVVPEGYNKYVEAQKRIEAGPLDFSDDKTHFELIQKKEGRLASSPHKYWINETAPLRQALEAQADVMTDYLDENNIPLFVEFPEGTSVDGLKGEGVYLNTGTAAHINWDDGLKRNEQYRVSPDSEAGSYDTVRFRPPSENFGKPLGFLGALTGNPWITAAATVASGGDIKDVVKNVATQAVVKEIDIPIVEDGFASLGIDAELLGMEAAEFSDRMMDVQSDILTGESGTDALLDNFGKAAVSAVADTVDINVDLPESELLSDLGDALKPIVGAVREAGSDFDDAVLQPIKTGLEPAVDAVQQGIDVVQEAVQPISDITSDVEDDILETASAFDDTFIDPVLEAGSDVLSEGEDLLKEAGYVIDDLVDWESLLEGYFASKEGGAKTPTESLFEGEIYKTPLKQSPDKIFSDEAIAGFLNKEKNKNTENQNSISSLLFSDPKNTEEEKLETSARKRQNMLDGLLSSAKQKASGLFL